MNHDQEYVVVLESTGLLLAGMVYPITNGWIWGPLGRDYLASRVAHSPVEWRLKEAVPAS